MWHLFDSRARLERQSAGRLPNGQIGTGWFQVEVEGDPIMSERLTYLPCRIDVGFYRPGKDVPPAINAGAEPDRMAVVYVEPDIPVMAGDRVVTVPDEYGNEVVHGVFELKVSPDLGHGYDDIHHKEFQAVETVQDRKDWPTA